MTEYQHQTPQLNWQIWYLPSLISSIGTYLGKLQLSKPAEPQQDDNVEKYDKEPTPIIDMLLVN